MDVNLTNVDCPSLQFAVTLRRREKHAKIIFFCRAENYHTVKLHCTKSVFYKLPQKTRRASSNICRHHLLLNSLNPPPPTTTTPSPKLSSFLPRFLLGLACFLRLPRLSSVIVTRYDKKARKERSCPAGSRRGAVRCVFVPSACLRMNGDEASPSVTAGHAHRDATSREGQ